MSGMPEAHSLPQFSDAKIGHCGDMQALDAHAAQISHNLLGRGLSNAFPMFRNDIDRILSRDQFTVVHVMRHVDIAIADRHSAQPQNEMKQPPVVARLAVFIVPRREISYRHAVRSEARFHFAVVRSIDRLQFRQCIGVPLTGKNVVGYQLISAPAVKITSIRLISHVASETLSIISATSIDTDDPFPATPCQNCNVFTEGPQTN